MLLWQTTTPGTVPGAGADNTRKTETARRHALEERDKDLKAVQVLEAKLGVQVRWVPESQEWQEAGRLVAMRKYQRALDSLESLVVARLFELSKMNRSQTGELSPIILLLH